MPKRSKPRAGSLQYWPRKRAKRIYLRIRSWPESKEPKPLGFAGWKVGMTHVQIIDNNSSSPSYGKIISKPVTIIDAAPLFVCALRYYEAGKVAGEKWAKDLPKNIERKTLPSKKEFKGEYDDVRLVVCTQPEKSGMKKKKPEIFEIALGGSFEEKKKSADSLLGKEITAGDVFKEGEVLDAIAVTKGHGFTGPVKRFGIKIQGRKDDQHHRHAGSIGGVVPRKVDYRVPLPGQYGFHTRTEYGKRLLMIGDDVKKIMPKGGFLGYGIPKSFLLIEGSVPGPRKRLIRLRKSIRPKPTIPVEIKFISQQSKQGN